MGGTEPVHHQGQERLKRILVIRWGRCCQSKSLQAGLYLLQRETAGMTDSSEERGWYVRRTGQWRALALLAATLVLCMSTWFSASAVIPQLRVQWDLSDSAAAWLTIAVQLGFVFGALISSLVNLSDVVSPRHVILGGAVGAATVNGLLVIAGGPIRRIFSDVLIPDPPRLRS